MYNSSTTKPAWVATLAMVYGQQARRPEASHWVCAAGADLEGVSGRERVATERVPPMLIQSHR